MARATRREFDKPTKAAIKKRVTVPTGFLCEGCGAIVTSGEIDHVIAEGLVIDKAKKLTAEDGQFLCWPCHQGPDGKTPGDKAAIAEAKRRELANLRIVDAPEIQGGPMATTERAAKRRASPKTPVAGMSEIMRRIGG